MDSFRTHRTVVSCRKNHRRHRQSFTIILGSARVQIKEAEERGWPQFFYFKNKYIRISFLLEGISRKKLSQNSCSGFAFTQKRKDS
jgi:hypothetical protein